MPTSNLRRLRGAFGLAITWAITWAIAVGVIGGLTTSLVILLRGHFPPVGGLMAAFALAGALSGFVSGAGFALLLTTSARRRTLDELNPLKFGALGAIPAAIFGLLLFREAGLAMVAAGFGFVAATGSLIMARRAPEPELLPARRALSLRGEMIEDPVER
jgi:hypothetical protein